MDFGIKGNAVCISGGTKGMGRACALAYSREGARIVVTGRNQHDLDTVVSELRALGSPDAFGIRCDIADPLSIVSVFDTIAARWGELHTLINMAGPVEPQGGTHFADLSDEGWLYYHNAGLMSVVRCSRQALPLMRNAGWGRIVNISSITSRLGQPPEAGYMVTKAAINALTKNMAWGLAKEDILVNCVVPGAFDTPLLAEGMLRTDPGQNRYSRGDLVSAADWIGDTYGRRSVGVIGRVARPEEVVPHVLLLGSRANSYVTGVNFPVDGGTDFPTG
jgi:3-oxoacyl-[acyl-carrier protein] reductase